MTNQPTVKRVLFNIDPDLHQALRRIAVDERRTYRAVILDALADKYPHLRREIKG